MRTPKRRYAIIYEGKKVGESWAVSAEKAINNYWWINDKNRSQFTQTDIRPSDYDAVEL